MNLIVLYNNLLHAELYNEPEMVKIFEDDIKREKVKYLLNELNEINRERIKLDIREDNVKNELVNIYPKLKDNDTLKPKILKKGVIICT